MWRLDRKYASLQWHQLGHRSLLYPSVVTMPLTDHAQIYEYIGTYKIFGKAKSPCHNSKECLRTLRPFGDGNLCIPSPSVLLLTHKRLTVNTYKQCWIAQIDSRKLLSQSESNLRTWRSNSVSSLTTLQISVDNPFVLFSPLSSRPEDFVFLLINIQQIAPHFYMRTFNQKP